MRKKIIGIMGPGPGATTADIENALALGKSVAKMGLVLLTGGMGTGVMDAASRGAKEAGGVTIGILPTADTSHASQYIDIPVVTGMGSARNNINVLTSDLVVALGMGPGTASEISLAVKAGKKVVMLSGMEESRPFFEKLGKENIYTVKTAHEAIEKIGQLLSPGLVP